MFRFRLNITRQSVELSCVQVKLLIKAVEFVAFCSITDSIRILLPSASSENSFRVRAVVFFMVTGVTVHPLSLRKAGRRQWPVVPVALKPKP